MMRCASACRVTDCNSTDRGDLDLEGVAGDVITSIVVLFSGADPENTGGYAVADVRKGVWECP